MRALWHTENGDSPLDPESKEQTPKRKGGLNPRAKTRVGRRKPPAKQKNRHPRDETTVKKRNGRETETDSSSSNSSSKT